MQTNRQGTATIQHPGVAKPAGAARPIRYRESDGKPMGETEVHVNELLRLFQILKIHFGAQPDVYVGGDLILYYEEGNPRKSVVPDVFVAVGAAKLPLRLTYLLWQEGVPPTVVIEVTSRSTSRRDRTVKWELYARLGVQEYFLYDPRFPGWETRYPPLQGYRLAGTTYQPMAADVNGRLVSAALGLRFEMEAGRLRLTDVASERPLLDPFEVAQRNLALARQEQQRADQERARANQERARADQEQQRAGEAEARATRAQQEIEQERTRADAEAQARRAAEERIAELERLLSEQQQQGPDGA